jgi:hypothetical protein
VHRRIEQIDPARMRADAPLYVVPGLDVPGFNPTMLETEAGSRRMQLTKFAEDDATGVKMLMRRLREIAREHGCTIILVGHVAKGAMDAGSAKDRGMRGSGAFTANARVAFGLWSADTDKASSTLKRFGIEPTDTNKARVVQGMITKANQGARAGVITYLRGESSGVLRDVSAELAIEAASEAELLAPLLVSVIQEAASLGLPFALSGKAGLHARREDLPEPFNGWGNKKLEKFAREMIEGGQVEKCRGQGGTAPQWLDVPGGDFATGKQVRIAAGSLAEARRGRERGARGGLA